MARQEKTIHYLYKTTCIITGRYYIGMHSTNNLNDGYMGSGKRLRYSIRKHGKNNHSKEILEFFENRDLLVKREIELVNLDLIKHPNCMNLVIGGGGFMLDDYHYKCSINGNKIHNEKLKNNIEYRESISKKISEKLKKAHLEGRMYVIKGGWNKDKQLTDEHKKLIGVSNSIRQKGNKNSNFNNVWVTKDGENKKIKKENLEELILLGWRKGKVTIEKDLLFKMKFFYLEGNSFQKVANKFVLPKTTVRMNLYKIL